MLKQKSCKDVTNAKSVQFVRTNRINDLWLHIESLNWNTDTKNQVKKHQKNTKEKMFKQKTVINKTNWQTKTSSWGNLVIWGDVVFVYETRHLIHSLPTAGQRACISWQKKKSLLKAHTMPFLGKTSHAVFLCTIWYLLLHFVYYLVICKNPIKFVFVPLQSTVKIDRLRNSWDVGIAVQSKRRWMTKRSTK